MKTLIAAFAVLLQIAPASVMAEDAGCPSTLENAEAAKHWSIVMDETEWMPLATYRPNPDIATYVEYDGLADLLVLDWYFPEFYKGRIGVLNYLSGAAGTHASTTFTRVAVFDFLTNELVANPMYSTETSGARYTENADGSTTETSYNYCDLGLFEWLPGKFTYTFDDEVTTYTLNGSSLD